MDQHLITFVNANQKNHSGAIGDSRFQTVMANPDQTYSQTSNIYWRAEGIPGDSGENLVFPVRADITMAQNDLNNFLTPYPSHSLALKMFIMARVYEQMLGKIKDFPALCPDGHDPYMVLADFRKALGTTFGRADPHINQDEKQGITMSVKKAFVTE